MYYCQDANIYEKVTSVIPWNCPVTPMCYTDVYSDSIVKLMKIPLKTRIVLGLHALIKREIKVTGAVLLTLCDILSHTTDS